MQLQASASITQKSSWRWRALQAWPRALIIIKLAWRWVTTLSSCVAMLRSEATCQCIQRASVIGQFGEQEQEQGATLRTPTAACGLRRIDTAPPPAALVAEGQAVVCPKARSRGPCRRSCPCAARAPLTSRQQHPRPHPLPGTPPAASQRARRTPAPPRP